MTWLYNGKPLTEAPEGYFGFIYLITNTTNDKKYIGRKYFTKAARKQVKGRKLKIRKENDWQDYYGSSEDLQADIKKLGKKNFTREIIHLCKSRGMTNYMELRELIDRRTLESPDFYNSWISAKIHRSSVKISG